MADIYVESDIVTNPECAHGPTLMFFRKNNGRNFFACSAYRDRKLCKFFLWADENIKTGMKILIDEEQKQMQSTCYERRNLVQMMKRTSSKKRGYCCTCETLCLLDNTAHEQHKLLRNLSDQMLSHPLKILSPKETSKGESQFYFETKTLSTISTMLSRLNFSRMVSIGCPSLHQAFSSSSSPLDSILLDLDHRYVQFYDSRHFQRFNMFNCHMFETSGWHELRTFVGGHRFAIIMDPPFGGRLEALAYTLKKIMHLLETNIDKISVFLVLPYFMELSLKQSLPSFSMLDYIVQYENHNKFSKGQNATQRGSAVRIFTNICRSKIELPSEEGYKFCEACNRWVHALNQHCFKCNDCTAKNGARYKHCQICGKCVKNTWIHCNECDYCTLPDHRCLEDDNENKSRNFVRSKNDGKKSRKRFRRK